MDLEHLKTIAFVDNHAEMVDKVLPTLARIFHECFVVDVGTYEVFDQRSLVWIGARAYALGKLLQIITVVELQSLSSCCHVREMLSLQVKNEDVIEGLMKGFKDSEKAP